MYICLFIELFLFIFSTFVYIYIYVCGAICYIHFRGMDIPFMGPSNPPQQ